MTIPAIWFPTIKAKSGSDKFTEQLVDALNQNDIRAEITWLPHHAEYLPFLVKTPKVPNWANIVHINTWLPSAFYPKNIPVVATLHHCVQDKAYLKYTTNLQKLYHYLWITPIEKKSINQATALTTVSQYTASCAKDIFNIANIEVIYNGVDLNIFNTNFPKVTKENRIFRLLFVGNSSVRKGFDLLPSIMEQLGDRYMLFYTANSSIKLPSNMKKLPYQETAHDLATLYRSMDALLFPSRLEGFGLVVAEAMACGLPVIVANSSALPELVDDKITGFVCQKDNINDFVSTIRYINENSSLSQLLSNNAKIKIQKEFTITHMVNSYLKLYKDILAKN